MVAEQMQITIGTYSSVGVCVCERKTHLIVVRRELMEQLFDAIFLSWAVHIGHLVLW